MKKPHSQAIIQKMEPMGMGLLLALYTLVFIVLAEN